MIDLDKLSPAPWVPFSKGFDAGWFQRGIASGDRVVLSSCHNAFGSKHPSEDDEAFIILARQALDVMMRRGWHAYRSVCLANPSIHVWRITTEREESVDSIDITATSHFAMHSSNWPDPFIALVEADKWLTEQEKGRR